jgi:hypothetical protein
MEWCIKDLRDSVAPLVARLKNLLTECTFIIHSDVSANSSSTAETLRLSVLEMTNDKVSSVAFDYAPHEMRATKRVHRFRVWLAQLEDALETIHKNGTISVFKLADEEDRLIVEHDIHNNVVSRRYVDLIPFDVDTELERNVRLLTKTKHTFQARFAVPTIHMELKLAANTHTGFVTFEFLSFENNYFVCIRSTASRLTKFCVCKSVDNTDSQGNLSFSNEDAAMLQPPDLQTIKFKKLKPLLSIVVNANVLVGFLKDATGTVFVGIAPDRPLVMSCGTSRLDFGSFSIATGDCGDDDE